MNGAAILLLIALSAFLVQPGFAEPFDECGILWETGACITFERAPHCTELIPTDLAILPDSLRYYRPVRIRGDLVTCYQNCGGWFYDQCLVDTQVSDCEPIDLGCGVLLGEEEEGGCCDVVWVSLNNDDVFWVGFHGHSHGDSVGVIGVPVPCVVDVCMCAGSLWGYRYYACGDTPPATDSGTWGSLKELFR